MSVGELRVRPMRAEDWGWIQEWFADPKLNAELGPLDEEWRDYVLGDESGVELVVSAPAADGEPAGEQPVALVGCVWETVDHPHTVSDLAVDPARRGQGIGRRALATALTWAGHPGGETWVSFVDLGNPEAHAFFTALGWENRGVSEEMTEFTTVVPRTRAVHGAE